MSQEAQQNFKIMQVCSNESRLLFECAYEEERFRLLLRGLACVTGSRVVLQKRNVIALVGTVDDLGFGATGSLGLFCEAVLAGVPVWEAFQLHARILRVIEARPPKKPSISKIDQALLRYALAHVGDNETSGDGKEESQGVFLSDNGPMVFYTRAVALLNNVREVALCETLDRIGLHSFSGGDIESGVSQVKSRTLVHTIKKLCVINPLTYSWDTDEAQAAAQMRMALWERDDATAKMVESSERDLITASAKFTWADRDRELELVGEMHRKRDDWSLRRLVCTIARPADQGGFKLRLVVDWPKGETRRLFYECLGFCDGVEPSPTVDDGPSTGSLYEVPDHVCEVRMRDSRIVAVAPASVAWHIAYGTWSYVEGNWNERPRVVLTCTEDVPQMARKVLLEITRSYEGLDSTQRAYIDSILADIDSKVERWRSANGDVDAALEQQRRRVTDCFPHGSWQGEGPAEGKWAVAYDKGQLWREERFEARVIKKQKHEKTSGRMQRWHPFVGWERISGEARERLEDDLIRMAQTIDRNRDYINICVNEQYGLDRGRYDSLKAELGFGDKYMPQIVLLCGSNDAAAQLIMTILTDRAARLWGTSDEDRPKAEPQPEPEMAESRRVPERLEPVLKWAAAILDSDNPGPDELTVASLLMGGEAFVLQFEDVCASVALERGGESPFLPFPATVTLTGTGACAAFEDEVGQVHYVPISGEIGESECKVLVAFVNDCCGMSGDGEHIRAVYDEDGQTVAPRSTAPRPRSPIRAFPGEPQTSRSKRTHASPREHVRRACWVMQPCGPGRQERRRTLRRATIVMKNGVSRTRRRSMDGSGNLIVPVVMAGR